MLWELACHFHISVDVTGSKGVFVWHMKWMEYFLIIVGGPGPISINKPSVEELKKHLEQHKVPKKVMIEDNDGLTTSTVLLSYHHWASLI